MAVVEIREFGNPDRVRTFRNGRTELCELAHVHYHVTGTLRTRIADGAEFVALPGQVTTIPPGHDAWVEGDERVVVIDWRGAGDPAGP